MDSSVLLPLMVPFWFRWISVVISVENGHISYFDFQVNIFQELISLPGYSSTKGWNCPGCQPKVWLGGLNCIPYNGRPKVPRLAWFRKFSPSLGQLTLAKFPAARVLYLGRKAPAQDLVVRLDRIFVLKCSPAVKLKWGVVIMPVQRE